MCAVAVDAVNGDPLARQIDVQTVDCMMVFLSRMLSSPRQGHERAVLVWTAMALFVLVAANATARTLPSSEMHLPIGLRQPLAGTCDREVE